MKREGRFALKEAEWLKATVVAELRASIVEAGLEQDKSYGISVNADGALEVSGYKELRRLLPSLWKVPLAATHELDGIVLVSGGSAGAYKALTDPVDEALVLGLSKGRFTAKQ